MPSGVRILSASVVAAMMTAPARAIAKVPPPAIITQAATRRIPVSATARPGEERKARRRSQRALVSCTSPSSKPRGPRSSRRSSDSREEIATPIEPIRSPSDSASNGDVSARMLIAPPPAGREPDPVQLGDELYPAWPGRGVAAGDRLIRYGHDHELGGIDGPVRSFGKIPQHREVGHRGHGGQRRGRALPWGLPDSVAVAAGARGHEAGQAEEGSPRAEIRIPDEVVPPARAGDLNLT